MNESNRVLVVDDEPNIVDVISMALRFQGFAVESAGTGADALAAVGSFRPDLIVLDVMLPDMEGFEVARRLGAERAGTPIIFLTARDSPEDKIRGLTTGGDDYVTKPFSLEELLARVRNVLRRSGRAEADSSRLTFEDLELDEDTREVTRAGTRIDLTATEYRLLRYLLLNPRRVLTRGQLLDHVWDYDFGGDARVLETYISYLRKKLDVHGPSLIHTVRGVGYTLRAAMIASLRGRLVAGVLVLAAAGMLLVGGITYATQRSFQLKRVDQALEAAVPDLGRQLGGDKRPFGGHGGPGRPPAGGGAPLDTYGERRGPDGSVIVGKFLGPDQTGEPPDLPADLPLDEPTTVEAGASGDYRVLATRDPNGRTTTVVALPLAATNQLLERLLVVEGIVIAGVLALVGMFAWIVVRVGLLPLDRMGHTAAAIAGGDLSHRVEMTDPRTEVGRLGTALNRMLDRLEQAFAAREASQERLRRFIADASHELRTPLASIRGYAELYRMGAARDPADVAKAMRRIEDEAARMGVLVEDLLTLARLDEIRPSPHGPVDLAALARDAVDDARVTAPARDIALRIAPAAVSGDADQLRQVLANLLRNALVHTPAGTPIEVSVGADGAMVGLAVRDHGPGLPTDDPDALFERFWRAEGGRERGKDGAGLGLAIVAGIVDAHDGAVSATNAPGGGASFEVRLPART